MSSAYLAESSQEEQHSLFYYEKISYSFDSKLIAAIYEGNNLDIFDTQTSECVYSIFTENQQYSLVWNPNKYILAYCGDDKNRNNVDEGNIHLLINQY